MTSALITALVLFRYQNLVKIFYLLSLRVPSWPWQFNSSSQQMYLLDTHYRMQTLIRVYHFLMSCPASDTCRSYIVTVTLTLFCTDKIMKQLQVINLMMGVGWIFNQINKCCKCLLNSISRTTLAISCTCETCLVRKWKYWVSYCSLIVAVFSSGDFYFILIDVTWLACVCHWLMFI